LRLHLSPVQHRAAIVAVCFALHGTAHVLRGTQAQLLWACNIGAALVAYGMLTGHSTPTSIGTLWLAVGTPLWIADLLKHGGLMCTSILTHGVILAIALAHTRQQRLAQRAWFNAALAGALLQQIVRWTTHWRDNINMAWGIYAPARRYFNNYTTYWVFSFATLAISYFVIQRFTERLHQGSVSKA
jgi:phosphotransferase system  glucose/maltose/N-acetylglucosamine-specific IIC component